MIKIYKATEDVEQYSHKFIDLFQNSYQVIYLQKANSVEVNGREDDLGDIHKPRK